MNNKKKLFIAFWAVITALLFYFFQPNMEKNDELTEEDSQVEDSWVSETEEAKPMADSQKPVTPDELPTQLKDRIDDVLNRIEGMWDPTGSKVKEVGLKMDQLEKALEDNNAQLAEKILSEIEVIVSEK